MKCLFLVIFLLFSLQLFSQHRIHLNKNTYLAQQNDSARTQLLATPSDEIKYIGLHLYQGMYYLYAPCDEMYSQEIRIYKDSLELKMGEATSWHIDNLTKTHNGITYDISSENVTGRLSAKPFKNNMYIMEYEIFYDTEPIKDYLLMVKTTDAYPFSLIVNNCPYEKNDEMKFEDANLKEIFDETGQ